MGGVGTALYRVAVTLPVSAHDFKSEKKWAGLTTGLTNWQVIIKREGLTS